MAAAFRYVHRSGVNLSASDATAYFPPSGHDAGAVTTEANAQSLMRQAYTAKNLFAYVSTYTGTISIVYRSRDSGVNGNLTFTPTTTGVWEDTSNTDTLASGDLYCIEGAFTGLGHAEAFAQTVNAVTLENATSVGLLLASTSSEEDFSSLGNVRIAGSLGPDTATEAETQRTVRTSATLAKLFVRCSGVSGPVSPTFVTRVNAAPGAQSVSPTAIGTYEDTSNTDTVAIGDEINFKGTTSSGNFRLMLAQVQTTSDAIQHVAFDPNLIASTLDYSYSLDAGNRQTLEVQTQVTMRTTNVLKNFYTYVSAYSLNATPTVRMRINATDNALGVSPNATGVWEDTSNTIALAATDEANYNVDTSAASSGSITCTVVSVEETQPVTSVPSHPLAHIQRYRNASLLVR